MERWDFSSRASDDFGEPSSDEFVQFNSSQDGLE